MAQSFEEWMAKVDAKLIGVCYLDSQDLPDYCYRDAFDDGVSPSVAAMRAYRAAEEG
jgi:hypothetical protein